MELQLEILETKAQRRGESTISFARKSGTVTLSTQFCRDAKVKHGDRMALAKDPQKEKDWYLVIFNNDNDPKGVPSRRPDEAGCMFNCGAFVHAFMDQFASKDDKSIRVPLATAPNEILNGRAKAFAILTKALEI